MRACPVNADGWAEESPPQDQHLFETEAAWNCRHQRRLSSTTLAPWRSVILAFGLMELHGTPWNSVLWLGLAHH